jgi:cell division protein FtsW (lipid II flippase)
VGNLYLIIPWVVMAYCAIQTARDVHRKNYAMAAIGAAAMIALLFFPIPTHAVLLEPFTAGVHSNSN